MNFRLILGSALVLVSSTGLLHGAEIAVPISNASKDASTASTAAGMSGSPGFAGDGGSVFFLSDAPNLNAPARQRPVLDLYRRDLASGITERVFPRRSESDLPDGDIEAFSVSSRGDRVAAATRAGNLLPGDTNGRRDVFVRDLVAGPNVLVSVGVDGRSPLAESWQPRISANGRRVVFTSTATNVVAGVGMSLTNVYVRDLDAVGSRVVFLSGTAAHLYSVSDGSVVRLTADIGVATLSLSQDGTRLAMLGNITNVANRRAVYWRDLATTTNCLIAAANNGYSSQNIFAKCDANLNQKDLRLTQNHPAFTPCSVLPTQLPHPLNAHSHSSPPWHPLLDF